MKTRVGVFFGGPSVEHEISIITAMQVIAALRDTDYESVPIYISKQGEWYSDASFTELETFTRLDTALLNRRPLTLIRDKQRYALVEARPWGWCKRKDVIDVALLAMHGTGGEDGTLQGYLQTIGIPYTGCGVTAAAAGQDKVLMKQAFVGNKIPICSWTWCYRHEIEESGKEIARRAKRIGYPLIVKPANTGSSIGIRCVKEAEELTTALQYAAQFDNKIVIEKKLASFREFNCACVGNEEAMVWSAVEEIQMHDEIFTFHDKYEGGKGGKEISGDTEVKRLLPAEVSEELEKKIHVLAIKACKAIGARGVCRVDFLYDTVKQELYVNEINTIPGSMAYYLFEAVGITYSQLLERLLKEAVRAAREADKTTTTFETNVLATYVKGTKGSKG